MMGADITVPGWLICGEAFNVSKLDRPAKISSIDYYSGAYFLSLTDQTSMVDIGYLTALESPDMSYLVWGYSTAMLDNYIFSVNLNNRKYVLHDQNTVPYFYLNTTIMSFISKTWNIKLTAKSASGLNFSQDINVKILPNSTRGTYFGLALDYQLTFLYDSTDRLSISSDDFSGSSLEYSFTAEGLDTTIEKVPENVFQPLDVNFDFGAETALNFSTTPCFANDYAIGYSRDTQLLYWFACKLDGSSHLACKLQGTYNTHYLLLHSIPDLSATGKWHGVFSDQLEHQR